MKRVVILGGGVIGLCSAYYAVRAGHQVTVIDRTPEVGGGCSYGNAGMIVPSHVIPLAAPGMVALGLRWMWNPESPFFIRPRLDPGLLAWGWRFWRAATKGHVDRCAPVLRDLSLESRQCYISIAAETGNRFGLVEKGLLMLCNTRHGLDEEVQGAARANELGVPADVLTPGEIARLEPGLKMSVLGGVHYPKDCHLSPHRFMETLKEEIHTGGGVVHWNTKCGQWRVDGARITGLETDRGLMEADEFVLCGGAWSMELAKGLGLSLPMQAGKGYSLTIQKPQQVPSICCILMEARVAVTPMGGALRFGGTMELSGMSEQIDSRRVRGIVKAVPSYFPQFNVADFDGVKPWAGLRPCSPDGMPYVGRTRHLKNLVVATGHAMLGLSLGPVTGRIVGQLLSEKSSGLDLGPLDPDRFSN